MMQRLQDLLAGRTTSAAPASASELAGPPSPTEANADELLLNGGGAPSPLSRGTARGIVVVPASSADPQDDSNGKDDSKRELSSSSLVPGGNESDNSSKSIGPFLGLFMALLFILCAWSYIDVLREDGSIGESRSNNGMFFRVHKASGGSLLDGSHKLNHDNKLVPKKLPSYVDDDFVTNITAIIGKAVSDPKRSTSALPRTSNRPYNQLEAGHRYLLYSPSGGFSNQLYCFLSAAYIAKVSNRTLLVPPKGRHSNMWWGYYALTQPNVIPMDHALDLPYIEKAIGVRMQPLNITLKSFHKKMFGGSEEDTDILHFERIKIRGGMRKASHKYQGNFAKKVAASDKQVVWAQGKFYSKYLGVIKGKFADHVRYSPYLIQLSKVIAREHFNGTFNAFHIRMGDYSGKAQAVSSNARAFAAAAKKIGMKKETPVYIATDSTSKLYFKPITKYWKKVIRGNELNTNPVVKQWLEDFYTRLPATTIRNSLFGLVDQLICTRAQKYVGTLISTFSRVIVYQRDNLATVAPDLLTESHPKYDVKERSSILVWWGGGAKEFGKNNIDQSKPRKEEDQSGDVPAN